jgi:methyl acetate hydrolase
MHDEIDRLLEEAVNRGDLTGVAAAVVTPKGTYVGVAGQVAEGAPMKPDTIVWMASMTKAVTALAAMQLVEQGRVELDAPCGDLVPYLAEVAVLDGFAEDGEPLLRPPARPVTLRHLLTHTAGFGYDFTDARLARYLREQAVPSTIGGTRAAFEQPLLFDPGERWTYGLSIDWAGQVVEAVTGTRIDRYVESAVLEPLGMHDSGFHRDAGRRARTASMHRRTPEGLVPVPFEILEDPEFVLAGGGLYSTVSDYLRFARLILAGGELDGVRVLSAETVRTMAANHIGELTAPGWRSANPVLSNDVDFFPGMVQRWGLSFLINAEATPEGRAPGSLAWAGLANTYYWIDPTRQVAGVFATQVLPFFDRPALDTFRAVERAAYASL